MTTDEIEKLIKACKNAGVRELKLDKMRLEFFPPSDQAVSLPSTDAIEQEIAQKLAEDEDLHDLRMQNLLLQDPLAHEEEMRKVLYADERQRTGRAVSKR